MIRSWIKAVQQRRQSRKELKLAEFESMFEQAMNKHIEAGRIATLDASDPTNVGFSIRGGPTTPATARTETYGIRLQSHS